MIERERDQTLPIPQEFLFNSNARSNNLTFKKSLKNLTSLVGKKMSHGWSENVVTWIIHYDLLPH